VSRTLLWHVCNVRIHLRVSLSTLYVFAQLLSNFLIFWSLPFWKPTLSIRLRTWVLRVKAFGVLYFFVAFLWNKELSTTCCLLHNNVSFLIELATLWHSLLYQLLYIVWWHILIVDWWLQRLLHFVCFLDVNPSNYIEVHWLNLLVTWFTKIKTFNCSWNSIIYFELLQHLYKCKYSTCINLILTFSDKFNQLIGLA